MPDATREVARLSRKLRQIRAVEVPRAGSSALNKTTALIRTQGTRATAARVRLKVSTIRKRVVVNRATPKKQRAQIKVYTRPISAISQFPPGRRARLTEGRGTNRRGTRVAGRQIDRAFVARGINGNLQVFRRRTDKRLPLEAIKFRIRGDAEAVFPSVSRRVMRSRYTQLLTQDLRFRLNKYRT